MAADGTKPVYVLYGNDGYLRDTHRKRIVDRIVGDADPQICVSTYDATAELAEVLDELRTLPFLAPHRVVIVHDADGFVSGNRAPLEKYLENPSANGTLVLIVSTWRSNTRLAKSVAKVGEAIACNEPDSHSLPTWIKDAVSNRGRKINNDAAELLAEWVGTDLAAINSEIEKLITYIGDRKTITVNDVGQLVTSSTGPAAFDLTNAITDGNVAAALTALGGMLNSRGDEFKTLGMLAWHLRRALAARQAMDAGKDPGRSLRMPYQQKQKFLAMLKRRPLPKIQSDFRKLIDADIGMKSGSDPSTALQELVVSLCT
ncbi:MAG: DNA polymerase III subunit delta [Phycisphaerae bacterium]